MLVSLLLLFLIPICYFLYYRELSLNRHFNFKQIPPSNPNELNESSDSDKILRKRYSKLKVPKDIDTVIIGSGISGLGSNLKMKMWVGQ